MTESVDNMDDTYRERILSKYFSGYYGRFMPESAQQWDWVLGRIDVNFRDVFSSLSPTARILDVACGVGYLEKYLLERGFANIDAIDISEEQIEVARQLVGKGGHAAINFETVDAFEYLGGNDDYDLISMFDFIEHHKKDEIFDLLRLAKDSLAEGGFLILRTINADNPLFSRNFYHDFTHETPFTTDSLSQCLDACGYEIEKIGYEEVPILRGSRPEVVLKAKRAVKQSGLWVLGRFLDFKAKALAEDLVAVARKI